MQRNPDESFEDYKERRAAANFAVTQINWQTKGGKENARAKRPGKGIVAYSYGNVLRKHFAERRVEAKGK